MFGWILAIDRGPRSLGQWFNYPGKNQGQVSSPNSHCFEWWSGKWPRWGNNGQPCSKRGGLTSNLSTNEGEQLDPSKHWQSLLCNFQILCGHQNRKEPGTCIPSVLGSTEIAGAFEEFYLSWLPTTGQQRLENHVCVCALYIFVFQNKMGFLI